MKDALHLSPTDKRQRFLQITIIIMLYINVIALLILLTKHIEILLSRA